MPSNTPETQALEPEDRQFKCAGCGNYANDVGSTMCQCATSILVRRSDSVQLVKPYLLHKEIEAIAAQREETLAKIRDGLGVAPGEASQSHSLPGDVGEDEQPGDYLRDSLLNIATICEAKALHVEAASLRSTATIVSEQLRKMPGDVGMREMLADDPDNICAGLSDAAIEAGLAKWDEINAAMVNRNLSLKPQELPDWDGGMIVAAIFKAVARATLTPSALSPEPVQKLHELPEGNRWCRHCEQKDPHCSVCEGVGYLPSALSGDNSQSSSNAGGVDATRVRGYLAEETAARECLATFPDAVRQRLINWQEGQSEWFSNTLLEVVAEFIAFDDAALTPSPCPGDGMLRALLQEFVDAMERYQMDVDDDAPPRHRDMMERAYAALSSPLSTPQRQEYDGEAVRIAKSLLLVIDGIEAHCRNDAGLKGEDHADDGKRVRHAANLAAESARQALAALAHPAQATPLALSGDVGEPVAYLHSHPDHGDELELYRHGASALTDADRAAGWTETELFALSSHQGAGK